MERTAWLVTIVVLCVLYIQSRGKTLGFYEDDEETVALEMQYSETLLNKSIAPIVFFNELSDYDPLLNDELKLEDFGFVHVPKTGGTFVEKLFQEKLDFDVGMYGQNPITTATTQGDEEAVKELHMRKCSFWHLPTRIILRTASKTTFPWGAKWVNQPKFTVVRDPLKRLISEYNYVQAHDWGRRILIRFCSVCKILTPQDMCKPEIFNDIVYNLLVQVFDKRRMRILNCHYCPQIEYLTDTTGSQHVRYVLKQEKLTEQMLLFLDKLGHTVTKEDISSFSNNHKTPECTVSASQLTRRTLEKVISVYKEDFERLKYDIPELPEE